MDRHNRNWPIIRRNLRGWLEVILHRASFPLCDESIREVSYGTGGERLMNGRAYDRLGWPRK